MAGTRSRRRTPRIAGSHRKIAENSRAKFKRIPQAFAASAFSLAAPLAFRDPPDGGGHNLRPAAWPIRDSLIIVPGIVPDRVRHFCVVPGALSRNPRIGEDGSWFHCARPGESAPFERRGL